MSNIDYSASLSPQQLCGPMRSNRRMKAHATLHAADRMAAAVFCVGI
jgi:hypothetical protein